MIYLLYGQPGSGKTTLGKLLADKLDTPFVIDGDEFRKMFNNDDYGKDGREQNIRGANAVATYLNKKSYPRGHVVMCLVNPYLRLRDMLRRDNTGQVVEILLSSTRSMKKEYHVEDFESGKPDHTLNTDRVEKETWQKLGSMLRL